MDDDAHLDQVMVTYHSGELAGLDGLDLLSCPFLDEPEKLEVWMLGYLEQPYHQAFNEDVALPDPNLIDMGTFI